jgi:predicted MFS family arabinose efflux permease
LYGNEYSEQRFFNNRKRTITYRYRNKRSGKHYLCFCKMRLFSLYRQAFSGLQRNIWVLSLAMFINRSGSMVLLFTSLYMTKELHFSIGQAGMIMGLYGIGSVAGSYLGGWLTDRINYFTVMIWALIGCGMVLLLMLWARSPLMIGLIIFTYPLIGDMFRPANSAAIAAYSTAENLTRSVSLVRLAVNLGFSVGPAAGGFIALLIGYKWLFALDALTSFAAAGLLFIYLPKSPPDKKSRKDHVKLAPTRSAYRDFAYLFFILLVALYGTIFFQIFASIPQYFSHVLHYTEDTIGLLMALNGAIVVVAEMPIVLLLEKKKRTFRYIIIGTLLLPLCFGVLSVGGPAIHFSLIYVLFITFSEILAMPFMMNHALSRGTEDRRGQYSALYSMGFGLATITAPTIGLGIADRWGFNTLFTVLISSSIVLALLFQCSKWVTEKTN